MLLDARRKRWIALLGSVLALVISITPLAAAQAQTDAVDQAVAYIRSQQQPDGSFAGFGPGSTADAVFALAAADENVADVTQGGTSAIDYIRSQAATNADVGVAAKFVIALLLAGQSPAQDGTDLVAAVQDGYNQQTGQYGADVTAHTYALIALNAAGAEIPPEAIEALKNLQNDDGGWSFDGQPGSASDTNTTSLAIQALVAVGDNSDALSQAVEYLRAQQNDDGGFPYSQTSEFGNASDANSTALSIQALLAAGENLDDWAQGDATPVDRLAAFQNESGAFRFQDTPPDDNQLATYQAVPALTGDTLPLESIVTIQGGAAASPAASPAAVAGTLPNTGVQDFVPVYVAVALLLLAVGGALQRRRA